jgi:hypothetical protein
VTVLKVRPDALEPKLETNVMSDAAILLLKPSPVMIKLGLITPAERLELVAICGVKDILETVTV